MILCCCCCCCCSKRFLVGCLLLLHSSLTVTHSQQNFNNDTNYYAQQETEVVCQVPIPWEGKQQVYTIGVLAIRGFEAAFEEFNATFQDYLTATAGQAFDPPIEFQLRPLDFVDLFQVVETQAVDYIYVNPSAFSCINSEYEALSLVSQVSRTVIGSEVYDLKKFGGVMATLAHRDDISSIHDLKDQIIAAASISGLGSGQMQFKEMIDQGMNYLQDPKQLVFTSNQGLVVQGLLKGDFDVGFIRTDQLERTKDSNGNLIDLDLFKIIDPKPNLTIDGIPFPFQSSTDLYAEWNVAALTHVHPDVSRQVQAALLQLEEWANLGEPLLDCYTNLPAEIATNYNTSDLEFCNDMPLGGYTDDDEKDNLLLLPCGTTREKALLARQAQVNGQFAGWTTSLSYIQLRSMQEATGFIAQKPGTNIWRCVRSTEIYDAISCPTGFDKKNKQQVATGCEELGLPCPDDFQCICRPCEEPYELLCVNAVQIGDSCLSLAIFLPSIIFPIVIVVGILVHFYVEYKRKQGDSLWIVQPKELNFGDPVTVIGRGTFGLVLLAEYRGTQVAVKRVIPPIQTNKNNNNNHNNASTNTRTDYNYDYTHNKNRNHNGVATINDDTLSELRTSGNTNNNNNFMGNSIRQSIFDESFQQSRASVRSSFDAVSAHPGMKSMAPMALRKAIAAARERDEEQKELDLEEQQLRRGQGVSSLRHLVTTTTNCCKYQRRRGGYLHNLLCFWKSMDDDYHNASYQEELKNEFVREIRQLARLRHPCITTVMGAVMPTRKDEPMLVMEYMSYGSLFDVLQDDSIILKPEQILDILKDVAQGLRFLHSTTPHVVIHGDLKAQNVLIDTNFCAKVTDFGLSAKKQIGAVGTPYWMSPELLTNSSINTTSSDVYAYGMLIYEIYSGRFPYDGEIYEDVVRQICDPQIRKRPPVPVHCPSKMALLMTECLQHDPIERPTAEQIDLAVKVEMKVKERTSRLEALNRELETANNKIASASAMQLQHFACMSHEIRTPLNCIIGLSSLLEETELNPMQKESMEMIVNSGKLLRQIVDDVLDYSKLESGNAEVLVKNVNLQDTLNAVVHLIKTSATAVDKDLTIKPIYDPHLPEFLKTDSRRIQQILYNLLGNAIKFSRDGQDVEFGVHITENGRFVSFTVKDYGKGIEEADYGKIFEPFRQTETGLSNTSGGTGLGLAITKKLVEAMKGKISVCSELGSWTQFTVDFPFDGQLPVDINFLSSRLESTTVFLIGHEESKDVLGTKQVLETFSVDYSQFSHMQEFHERVLLNQEDALSSEATYVCLVHELLYDSPTYDQLVENSKCCLVTFGPDFLVDRSRKHYRSLVETFPSVLVHHFGEYVRELRRDPCKEAKQQTVVNKEYQMLKILIAEDNKINQKVLTRMLNRLGVENITIANNGEEAVKKEAQEAFDLVLMDMQMPKMDGVTACREIHKRVVKEGNHKLAKIVFVTAHVSETFRQTCLDNGAVGFLPKPCTVDGVNEVLCLTMGHGSMFSPVYPQSWNNNTKPALKHQ